MRALLCLMMVVVGLLLLGTRALPVGLLMIAAAVWLFGAVGPAREERFTAILMILGGFGAVAVAAQFVLERVR